MLASAPNSELVRIVIVIAFTALTVVLRVMKRPVLPRPAPSAGRPKPLDALREAMRQGAEQGRPQRSPFQPPAPQVGDSFHQPPAIRPESPVLPSLLLVALLVCLCVMAYRFFAP